MGNNDELFTAASSGDLSAMKKCIANGANVNAISDMLVCDDYSGKFYTEAQTPLMVVCRSYRNIEKREIAFQMAEYLIEMGANVNICTKSYYDGSLIYALKLAVANDVGYSLLNDMTKLLIENGTQELLIYDILSKIYVFGNLYDNPSDFMLVIYQQSALLFNVKFGNIEGITQCIVDGLDVNFAYSKNRTVLMYACQKGNFEAVLTLIFAGADINAKDKNGKTVLNYAAEGGNAEIMKLLLSRGAK